MKTIALAFFFLAFVPIIQIEAQASTSCSTRKSGSITITSCSDSGHNSNFRQCRSYMSGSVRKTSCRS